MHNRIMPSEPPLLFFYHHIDFNAPSGCWNWTGPKVKYGYGQQAAFRGVRLPHRIAYLAMVEDLTPGLEIDHLCRNTSCVNPLHLEQVTKAENLRRRLRIIRETCQRGHRYAETGVWESRLTDGRRKRTCKVCSHMSARGLTTSIDTDDPQFSAIAADIALMMEAGTL